MIFTVAISGLTLYFALFLGVSGMAKIDRPLRVPGHIGPLTSLTDLLFSPTTSRVLGAFEIAVAFLLAVGIRTEIVAFVNAVLFGGFLLFKLFLMFTRLGSRCGCFGAHELLAVDAPSMVASTLTLGLAILLVILAQHSSPVASTWIVGTVFLTLFGWILLRTLWRRRLENQTMRRIPPHTV